MTHTEPSTRYDAAQIEGKWYKIWEEKGLFQPSKDQGQPTFVITIPPPNITGSLHMGHALSYSLQDLMGRYRRMRGDRVLVLPGQDHAGIGAQSVVMKNLKAQGIDPMALGREAFVEKVWEWRRQSGDTILHQFRSLGCAFDWSRTQFTLDDEYANAVLKVFIDWHDRGLIYRGLRVVNWDPKLKTSVSDIETERKDIAGKLYHIRYPFADGSGSVVIATTRPETMLADVAVAVHPSDARYEGLVGKEIALPLSDRTIPLISDIYPDPNFGTGAVKITPGHDANDWEVGQRHGLSTPVVFDEAGQLNHLAGRFAGLSRSEARKQIVAELEAADLLVQVQDHQIPMIFSSRSGEAIEPMASEQWFVRQTQLAERAIQVVESGEIKFVPERYSELYLEWMRNIRDWNISRQLWWGHRIPVYYTESGQAIAALSWEEAESKAGEPIVRQDQDVLDTWFSSGLWPFATLGWPRETSDMQEFFPTSSLVTARDIIYLWVARMIMMSLDFTGKVPFSEVVIHATVLTEDGKRMSKSLGTGIDPMETIEAKGADALRFALLSQSGDNQDLRYGDRRSDDARGLCNKIWNASRFILMNIGSERPTEPTEKSVLDQWLLSRLAATEAAVRDGYDRRDIQSASQALYEFFWNEVCDWYIEASKTRLQAGDLAPKWTLLTALEGFLKMLHPIMPFITEEISQMLPGASPAHLLVEQAWPSYPTDWRQESVEAQVSSWMEAIRAFRALRASVTMTPRQMVDRAYLIGDLKGGEELFLSQAWVKEIVHQAPSEPCVSSTLGWLELHLPTSGLIDPEKEIAKAQAELEKKIVEIKKLQDRLSNPQFVERAKPEVIARDQDQLKQLEAAIASLEARIRQFSG